MRSVTVRLEDLKTMVLNLGHAGENEHTRVTVDCRKMFEQYPAASAALTVQPPYGDAYPAVIERDGDFVIWDVTDSDLISVGHGEMQLSFAEEPHLAKSYIGKFKVEKSIIPTGEVPEPLDDFLTRAGAALTGIPETINSALAEAKASGEFDGPQGPAGQDGAPGQDGVDGVTPEISIGTVAKGTDPAASMDNTDPAHPVLSLTLPKGDKGDTGDAAPAEQVVPAVNAYLASVITNPDSPPLDRTLTYEEAAAPADVTGKLKSALAFATEVERIERTGVGYITTGGISVGGTVNTSRITQDSTYEYYIVPCVAGDVFTIDQIKAGSSPRAWCFIDSSSLLISVAATSNEVQTNILLTAPAGAAYLICNNYKYSTVGIIYKGQQVEKQIKTINKNLNDYFIATNLLYKSSQNAGYKNANGAVVSDSSYVFYGFPVKENTAYTISPRGRFVYVENGSGAKVYGDSANTITSFTSPADGTAWVTFYKNESGYEVYASTEKKIITDIDKVMLNPEKVEINPMNNKILEGVKIYNFGDSIASGAGNNDEGYAELMKDMYHADVTDYAISGATLSKVTGQSMSSVLDQIDNASANVPDVILLEGGANDYTQTRQMGSVTGETVFTSASFNAETYTGALELALYKLQTKYPGAVLIWIFTHRENSRTEKTEGSVTVNFTTMHDMSLEVCDKWSIPVVDIYNRGGLNTNWPAYKTAYTNNADGTHPNMDGYKRFYIPKILATIKELTGM